MTSSTAKKNTILGGWEKRVTISMRKRPVQRKVMAPRKKVCLVGPPNTGKTAFVRRQTAVYTPEPTPYAPTIGTDVTIIENFNVWDLAGQEAFRCLPEGYLINASGVVIVADRDGFWEDWVRKNAPPNARIVHTTQITMENVREAAGP
jgi:GTPase SAR1 family protein